jgi:hypothetical protein
MGGPMRRHDPGGARGHLILLAFAVLAIALATLSPTTGSPREWTLCLACGDRGTADLLLNVALFMPLGAALALRGRTLPFVALLAALLSGAIEVAQFSIPGRDPTLGDIVSNTLGATLGALLVGRARVWLFPKATVASWLCRSATVGAAITCLATGLLLTPSFPATQYYGLWTPNLGHLEWYRGRLLDAGVAGTRIGPGPIPARSRVAELLRSDTGYELHVRALAGPATQRLAPLFAIFDGDRREILLLGAQRAELVLRVHTRAAAWRFDRPDLRLPALQHVGIGDTVSVRVVGDAGNGRYTIDGTERGFTVGIGWALLMYPETFPFKAVVSAVWIGVVFLPAGFWLRTRIDGLTGGLGILSGLALVPALTPLLPTPASQWMAAALGLLGGVALQIPLRGVSARLLRPASVSPTSRAVP